MSKHLLRTFLAARSREETCFLCQEPGDHTRILLRTASGDMVCQFCLLEPADEVKKPETKKPEAEAGADAVPWGEHIDAMLLRPLGDSDRNWLRKMRQFWEESQTLSIKQQKVVLDIERKTR